MFKKLTVGAVAALLLLTGCTTAPPVTGTVKAKYIEDFTEYTLVVTADNGDEHHFTIEEDQWRAIAVGTKVSSADLQEPADD